MLLKFFWVSSAIPNTLFGGTTAGYVGVGSGVGVGVNVGVGVGVGVCFGVGVGFTAVAPNTQAVSNILNKVTNARMVIDFFCTCPCTFMLKYNLRLTISHFISNRYLTTASSIINLFAYAKFTENSVQQIIAGCFSGDFTQRIIGRTQINGDKIQRQSLLKWY